MARAPCRPGVTHQRARHLLGARLYRLRGTSRRGDPADAHHPLAADHCPIHRHPALRRISIHPACLNARSSHRANGHARRLRSLEYRRTAGVLRANRRSGLREPTRGASLVRGLPCTARRRRVFGGTLRSANHLPAGVVHGMFVVNITAISIVTCIALYAFVREQ